MGPPGHETPKGQGGVPRWNGPKTVRTLRRRQSLTARPKASGKQWEREEEVQFVALAGGTSRRSPPCSRRHALVTVHASFLVDEVVRQVRPLPHLSARGADVLVSVVTTRPTVSSGQSPRNATVRVRARTSAGAGAGARARARVRVRVRATAGHSPQRQPHAQQALNASSGIRQG